MLLCWALYLHIMFLFLPLIGALDVQKTNVIFIMYDDLRTELGAYGRKHMITPNFDRLAAKSVVFDKAYCQVAVCNPSRDSMLTGLRPDTVGTYAFQSSFRPHMSLNSHMAQAGYNTAGYGKISHWEWNDKKEWSFEQWDNEWYKYQQTELTFMNASTMPDKTRPEHSFRDWQFATKAISGLRRMATDASGKYFMLAVGFKLPHLAVHLPYKYFEMYKDPDRMEQWRLEKREAKFPYSAPPVAYRCCALPRFSFLNQEGEREAAHMVDLGNINMPFTTKMHDELMQGYCGSITFLDKQLGRLLDTIDEMQLWDNVTIVLTSDHGMHNGEKGLWEKWSLFDESTRVPLMIYHPQSENKGKHFSSPVELLDVYPTVLDLSQATLDRESHCGRHNNLCRHLQGKSLAPVVLGSPVPLQQQQSTQFMDMKRPTMALSASLEAGTDRVAISQTWRCSDKKDEQKALQQARVLDGDGRATMIKQAWVGGAAGNKRTTAGWTTAVANLIGGSSEAATKQQQDAGKGRKPLRYSNWQDCDKNTVAKDSILSVMGYSMRGNDFRYTAWYYWHKSKMVPKLDSPLYAEELYDVRGERPEDFTHFELTNVAGRGVYSNVTETLRGRLKSIIREEFLFRGPFKD